jgi:hypothetical protein
VDNSGFSTQGPTVYAGNLGYNKYIIQVSHMKRTNTTSTAEVLRKQNDHMSSFI